MKKKAILLLSFLLIAGKLQAQIDAQENQTAIGLGATLNDPNYKFTYLSNSNVPSYGLGWFHDSKNGGFLTSYLSSDAGIKLFTASTPRLSILYNGNVGIGVEVPLAPLEVRNPTNGWLMNLRTTAPNVGDINGIKLYSGFIGEDKWSGISSVSESQYSNNTGLALYANGTERLRISSDGKVGIGTFPSANLHIKTAEQAAIIRLEANNAPAYSAYTITRTENYNGTGTIGYMDGWGASNTSWGAGGKVAMNLYSGFDASLTLYTSQNFANIQFNTVGDSFLKGGYLGIGTNTPGDQLTVQDRVRVSTSNGQGGYYASDASTGGNSIFSLTRQGNDLALSAFDGIGFTSAARSGPSNAYHMFINTDGNVGIGTATPNGYKLAVNGSIHTKAVVVDLNGFPDYVFNPGYKLRPLAEVKSYIDQNHHLPEMPSEKEVSANGLNLGEINKLLTKKVEELTLYLIEKEKVQKVLEEKVSKLEGQEDKIKKLEAQMARLLADQ